MEQGDAHLARFESWLKKPGMMPRPGLPERVRERLHADAEAADPYIDALLKMDASLRVPEMAARVRQRLAAEEGAQEARPANWFNWLAPLAAAATLALAFMSFQTQTPRNETVRTGEDALASGVSVEAISDDSEVTRIFALAANLHASANMSDLQSVEELAFLFD